MPLVNDISPRSNWETMGETRDAAVELSSLLSHIAPLSQEELASIRAALPELNAADEKDEALRAWDETALDDWPDYDWGDQGPPRL